MAAINQLIKSIENTCYCEWQFELKFTNNSL